MLRLAGVRPPRRKRRGLRVVDYFLLSIIFSLTKNVEYITYEEVWAARRRRATRWFPRTRSCSSSPRADAPPRRHARHEIRPVGHAPAHGSSKLSVGGTPRTPPRAPRTPPRPRPRRPAGAPSRPSSTTPASSRRERVAEDARQRLGLGGVPDARARGVRVDVSHAPGFDSAVGQSVTHRERRTLPAPRRLRDVVRVGRAPVPANLRVRRDARAIALSRLSNANTPAPSPMTNPPRRESNGLQSTRGSPARSGGNLPGSASALALAKPANDTASMADSLPPHNTTPTSPRCTAR